MAGQPQTLGLEHELPLGGTGAGDDEPDIAQAPNHPRERVQGDVKTLLVHEPAHHQD